MSLHLDTLFWFLSNQSLLLLLNAVCVRHNSVLWNGVRLCYICNEKPYTDRTKSSLCFIPSSDFIIGDNCKGGHYLMLNVFSGEATNTNFIVFGLIQPPWTYDLQHLMQFFFKYKIIAFMRVETASSIAGCVVATSLQITNKTAF